MNITKKALSDLYDQYSNKEICEQLGICSAKLYKLLDEAGIKRKITGRAPRRKSNIKLVD